MTEHHNCGQQNHVQRTLPKITAPSSMSNPTVTLSLISNYFSSQKPNSASSSPLYLNSSKPDQQQIHQQRSLPTKAASDSTKNILVGNAQGKLRNTSPHRDENLHLSIKHSINQHVQRPSTRTNAHGRGQISHQTNPSKSSDKLDSLRV